MRSSLSLVHSVPSSLLALDADGRITALNRPAERLLGLMKKDVLGRAYPEILGPSLSNRVLTLYRLMAKEGDAAEPREIETSLPDGRRATLLANLGPIRDAKGKITGFLVAFEDRSSQAKDRAARDQETARAEQLHQALERYLGRAIS